MKFFMEGIMGPETPDLHGDLRDLPEGRLTEEDHQREVEVM